MRRLLVLSRGNPSRTNALFNGTTVAGTSYEIGNATSRDGTVWVTGATILSPTSGWESSTVKDPALIWDGAQYIVFYSGYDGSVYKIGRATAPTIDGAWTRYGSNPILTHGAGGSADEVGVAFPIVVYAPDVSPAWKMWYAGQPATWTTANPISTVCFADSSDGISWTKRGTVIARGAGGSFNEKACIPGCVFRSGATWYVYFGGFNAAFSMRSAYATCTDPASSGTYSAVSQLTNYTGNLVVSGRTFQSNMPRGIVPAQDGSYICYVDAWKPVDALSVKETCCTTTSPDLTAWAAPSSFMFDFTNWHTVSAENPSVFAHP